MPRNRIAVQRSADQRAKNQKVERAGQQLGRRRHFFTAVHFSCRAGSFDISRVPAIVVADLIMPRYVHVTSLSARENFVVRINVSPATEPASTSVNSLRCWVPDTLSPACVSDTGATRCP